MTRHIDVVMLISGLSEEALDLRRESLNQSASKGTDVRLVMTGFSPSSVESLAEMELAALLVPLGREVSQPCSRQLKVKMVKQVAPDVMKVLYRGRRIQIVQILI